MDKDKDKDNDKIKVKITPLISDEDRKNHVPEMEEAAPILQKRDPKMEVVANILKTIEEREKRRKAQNR
jgi:hypothetical protein